MDEFARSEHAETPLGKLLIALVGETVWSNDYTIYASFDGERPFLQVNHKTFLSENSLMIYDDAKTVLSVRGVEDAIRALIRESRKALSSSINLLQYRRDDLERVFGKIMWDKARAAIVAAFPQVAAATPSHVGTENDLYAFCANANTGPVFVARAVDGEFIGGTACVECSGFDWYNAGNGVEEGRRHNLFWAALAQAFAARELRIPGESLWGCEKVFASEKPWEFPQSEPYIVEKVIFSNWKGEIVVEFGSDNLPATVTVLPTTQEEPSAST
ncbi:MAG: hypothetical protein WC790_01295 [Candidatus Paceibacterota bacterium]|jgi:hypothetical protein